MKTLNTTPIFFILQRTDENAVMDQELTIGGHSITSAGKQQNRRTHRSIDSKAGDTSAISVAIICLWLVHSFCRSITIHRVMDSRIHWEWSHSFENYLLSISYVRGTTLMPRTWWIISLHFSLTISLSFWLFWLRPKTQLRHSSANHCLVMEVRSAGR